jgi:myo-inositol-1(or 4)-monophosphatase
MNMKYYLSLAEQAARQAGDFLAKAYPFPKPVLQDAAHDVKLKADQDAEKIIIDLLTRLSPFSVLSEECGLKPGADTGEFLWIVDPLDGTLNYQRQIPLSCVSIALWKRNEPFLGVIYDFQNDTMFSGIVGEGAWCDGSPIRVSEIVKQQDAVICTGFPAGTNFSQGPLLEFTAYLTRYKKVRLFGSAALSLAFVAAGKADVYSERDIKLWDVAAGLALVKAAGGAVEMSGDPEKGLTVLASNGCLAGLMKD